MKEKENLASIDFMNVYLTFFKAFSDTNPFFQHYVNLIQMMATLFIDAFKSFDLIQY